MFSLYVHLTPFLISPQPPPLPLSPQFCVFTASLSSNTCYPFFPSSQNLTQLLLGQRALDTRKPVPALFQTGFLRGFQLWLSRLRTCQVSMMMQVQFLASLSGLKCCQGLQPRSQMQLGSGITVALVQPRSCGSDSTPSLGTSICHGCSPKKSQIYKYMCACVFKYI